MGETIKVAVSNKELDRTQTNLHVARKAFYDLYPDEVMATISVVAYNRLETTKLCVESILKYTKDINYKLILAYNDSEAGAGILEYFESVDYDNKLIIHVTRNVGAALAYKEIVKHLEGKYYISLANDVIVTSNWLSNLIKCAESDPRIGMVNPLSSNTSNLQGVNLPFSNYEEMQAAAAKFNVSDPTKWQERLRLITIGTLMTRECVDAVGDIFDAGFFHDFGDDDISFRARRAGFKCIVAGDTWVHHDHDLSTRDIEKTRASIETGKKNFQDKYFGLDSWEATCNFHLEYMRAIKQCDVEKPKVLGIDVKSGTPLLGVKNRLRNFSVFETELFAYTKKPEYYLDLQTVCGATNVVCGKEDSLLENYVGQIFDYIVIGDCINQYENPIRFIKNVASLLSEKGQLLVSLKNTYDCFAFVYMIGYFNIHSETVSNNYSVEDFIQKVSEQGLKIRFLQAVAYDGGTVPQGDVKAITSMIAAIANEKQTEIMNRLLTDKYVFEITK